MADRSVTYTLEVHDETADGQGYWAEVKELPGCIASGDTMDELLDAMGEAIGLYLSDDDHQVVVRHESGQPYVERREFEVCSA
jgi:predicted RNase H-like HicB family nuclease